VPLTGRQKAAMLLMSLDAATAAELLKGINPDLVQELAVELAYLDATGYQTGNQSTQIARQFCNSLQVDQKLNFKSYLEQMMKSTVSKVKVAKSQTRINDIRQKKDPFALLRLLDSKTIASVLQKEHPRSAAVVLSELPPEKSSDVLNLLDQGIRFSAIRRMTTCKNMEAEAKAQTAETVCMRLKALTTDEINESEQSRLEQFVTKVASIAQYLCKNLRAALLGTTNTQDDMAGEIVTEPIMIWEDIPQLADGFLQKALRGINTKKLALALVEADDTLVQKITTNISARKTAAMNKQVVHLLTAAIEDVEEARREIIQVLYTRIKDVNG
jgi:flagellar motor switch protein FliG